jgi:transposase
LSSVTLLRALAHYGGPSDLAKDSSASGRLAKGNEVIGRQAKAVGMATACVLWVALGDPKDYPCGEAYRKAMGLNLKERSSGNYQGQLKIAKRGPSIVRRWMYFAAMRTAQSVYVKPWFEAKKAKDKDRGNGALIAVARKLALALHAVGARGEPFEPSRLFSQKELHRPARRRAKRRERIAFDYR